MKFRNPSIWSSVLSMKPSRLCTFTVGYWSTMPSSVAVVAADSPPADFTYTWMSRRKLADGPVNSARLTRMSVYPPVV